MNPSPEPDDQDDPDNRDCAIDHEDDIDWASVVATAEADYEGGEVAFDSASFHTQKEALEAMGVLIDEIFEEAMKRVRTDVLLDARS